MGKHSRRKPKCRGRRSKLFQGRPESYEDVNVKWNCLSSHGLQCEPGFFALSKYWRSKGKRTFWIKSYPRFLMPEYYGSVIRHSWRNMARRKRLFFLHKKRFFTYTRHWGKFLLRQLHVWRLKLQLLVRRFDNEPSCKSTRLLANPLLTEYSRLFKYCRVLRSCDCFRWCS